MNQPICEMVSPKINGPKVNRAQYTNKRVSKGRGCEEPQIWLNVVSMVLISNTADTISMIKPMVVSLEALSRKPNT